MADNSSNPFHFEASLGVNNLRKALSRAEKAYIGMSKGMGRIVGKLEGVDKAKQAFIKTQMRSLKSQAKEVRSEAIRIKVIKKTWRQERGIFKAREKLRKKDARLQRKIEKGGIFRRAAGAIFSKVGGAIAGAVGIGLITKAITDFLEFDKQIRSLNTTLSGTPKLMGVAAGAVQGLTGYIGLSREELVQMAKSLNVVALEVNKLPDSKRVFRGIMMDTIHLSKSMDVSAESVSDLFSTFLRVYKLPHHSLRGIAASMKFIQEQTGISGEELLSFGKNLDKIMSQMVGVSGKGKAKVTKDLMAMAGVLKKAGVDPNEILGIMTKAIDIEDEAGQKFLSFIAQGSGKSMEQIRQMILKGEVLDVAGMIGTRLRKVGKKTLVDYQRFFGEQTGMGIEAMMHMRGVTTKSLKDMAAAADAASKKQGFLRKRAERLQHSLSRMWNTMKRAFEKLWFAIGKRLTEFIQRVSGPVIKALTNWANWVMSPQGGKSISGFFTKVSDGISTVWKWIKDKLIPAFQWIGEKISWLWKKWSKLDDSTKAWIIGGAAALVIFGKMSGVLAALGSKVGGIAAGLMAVYAGAKAVAGWIDKQQTKQLAQEQTARSVTREVSMAHGKKTFSQRQGAIRSMIASKGRPFDLKGNINETYLAKKAMEASPGAGWKESAQRKLLISNWRNKLNEIKTGGKEGWFGSGQELKDAVAYRNKQIASLRATEKKVATTTTAPAKASVPAPPATTAATAPPIVIKADDKTRNMLLEAIRSQLELMHQSSTIKRAHPATAAIKGAL